MNFNVNRVKIIVTIPIENLEEVRNAICEAGAILFLFAIKYDIIFVNGVCLE